MSAGSRGGDRGCSGRRANHQEHMPWQLPNLGRARRQKRDQKTDSKAVRPAIEATTKEQASV